MSRIPSAEFNAVSEFDRLLRDQNRFGRRSATPSQQDILNYAGTMGWREAGGGRVQRQFGGGSSVLGMSRPFNEFAPLGMFASGAQRAMAGGAGGPQIDDQMLMDAFGSDLEQYQGAAKRQYERNAEQIAKMEELATRGPKSILDRAGQIGTQLEGVASGLDEMGAKQEADFLKYAMGVKDQTGRGIEEVLAMTEGVPDRVDEIYGDVDEAVRRADAAADEYADYIRSRRDMSAQNASAMALGIRRNAESQIAAVTEGVDPISGAPLTPEQQRDAMTRIRGETNDQVQAAVTGYISQAQQAFDGLRGNLAQLRQNVSQVLLEGAGRKTQAAGLETEAARTRLAATELGSQTGLEVGRQLLASQEGRRQLSQMATNVRMAIAQISEAAQLNAVNLEMQGRTAVASLVQSNPEAVFSMFQGLLAILTAQRAQQPAGGGMSYGPGDGGGVPEMAGFEDPMQQQAPEAPRERRQREPYRFRNSPRRGQVMGPTVNDATGPRIDTIVDPPLATPPQYGPF